MSLYLPRLRSLAAAAALAALLAGCGGQAPQAAAPEPPSPAAAGAEARAEAPPADNPDRYCLWLLWVADDGLLERAREEMAAGKPFMVVAREIAGSHPERSRTQADCLSPEGMDPALLEAVRGLAPGQVSRPLDLADGKALVMRTTDLFRRRAQQLFQEGRYAQAEEALLHDLELHPASSPAWHLLGLTRSSRQDYHGALRAFRHGLRWDPENPSLLNDKASALASLGRHEEALPVFEQALRLDPDNATVLENLAWTLTLAGGDLARAERLARRAVAQAPASARAWQTLGRVQAARDEHGPAVVSLHRAARLDPRLPKVAQELARSLQALPPDAVARLAPRAEPPAKAEASAAAAASPAPPASAPEAKAEPKPKPAPQAEAQPEPEAKAKTKPEPEPEPEAIPKPEAQPAPTTEPKPKAMPAPKAKAQPKPAPQAKAKAEPKAEAREEAGAGHFVQVASYRDAKLARRELANWRRLGREGRLEQWRQSPGRLWHRVLLGPYPSRDRARDVAKELARRNLISDYHLVSRTGRAD